MKQRFLPLVAAAVAISTRVLAQTTGPLVRGDVVEATTSRPLSGVTIQIAGADGGGLVSVLTNDAGRFEVRLDQRGRFNVVARMPGYSPSGQTIDVAADSFAMSIKLTRLAQTLPEVSVMESEIELFAQDVRRSFRSVGRSRVYDAAQMAHSGQLLAEGFLFGQAGIMPTSCKNSAAFIPEGKVRTQPVQREPADVWWPCYLDRGKPRPIMIRIDGGPPEPFAAISSRVLSEFATMAIVGGGVVIAYTKDYAIRKRSQRR